MYYIVAPLILSLILAILLGYILIPILKSKNLGQKILDIGPRWHKSKEGTPLLGGLLFIFGTLLAVLIFGITAAVKAQNYMIVFTYVMAFCCAVLGFADDYVKLTKKQNEGLTPIQKLVFQFAIAIAYVVVLKVNHMITTEIFIPFANINIDLGVFYYIFVVLGSIYVVNCVNFADGVDGLCGTVTSIVMIMFIILFHLVGDNGGLILASGCLGGLIGFLYFNFHPAKIWMGDTGSMFLGGMVVGFSLWLNIPLLILLFGVIYIIEGVSVLIQVTSFKLTGKRVFKMSPIHHHFEMSGWSEIKIVSVFSAITLITAALSVFGSGKL